MASTDENGSKDMTTESVDKSHKGFFRSWVAPGVVVAVVIAVLGFGIDAVYRLYDQISSLSQEIDGLDDPETGYPAYVQRAVDQGVTEALQRAAEADAAISRRTLVEAIDRQTAAIESLRSEIRGDIANQTQTLQTSLDRIDSEISSMSAEQAGLRARQDMIIENIRNIPTKSEAESILADRTAGLISSGEIYSIGPDLLPVIAAQVEAGGLSVIPTWRPGDIVTPVGRTIESWEYLPHHTTKPELLKEMMGNQ